MYVFENFGDQDQHLIDFTFHTTIGPQLVGGLAVVGGVAVITDKRDIVCCVKAGERGVWRVGTLATVSYTMFGRGFVDTFTDTGRAR